GIVTGRGNIDDVRPDIDEFRPEIVGGGGAANVEPRTPSVENRSGGRPLTGRPIGGASASSGVTPTPEHIDEPSMRWYLIGSPVMDGRRTAAGGRHAVA